MSMLWGLPQAFLGSQIGFDDYWSVDFAPSKGQWFVIDMAPGARSWHPDHRQS